MSLSTKKIKLANTTMRIANHMADLNNMLRDEETLKLWYSCPMTDDIEYTKYVTKSHQWSMISQWFKK